NERERCSELMADVGEEFDLHHIELVHAVCFFPFLLYPEVHPLIIEDQPPRQEQGTEYSHGVQHKSSFGFPERWKHNECERSRRLIPDAVVIGSLYLKYVRSRIEVGVGHSPLRSIRRSPVFIETFHDVFVLAFLGMEMTEGGELQRE